MSASTLTRVPLAKNDSTKQTDQLIAFIKQEARDKADEITLKTEMEFQSNKLLRMASLSKVLRDEVDRRKRDKIVVKKIKHSREIANARMQKMKERERVVRRIKQEVLLKLAEVSKSPKYPDLLRFLIAQTLMKVSETKVSLICRREDLDIVKKQLEPAIKQYQKIVENGTGIVPHCDVQIDTNEFLPPGPSGDPKAASCCGGVVISARDGCILCRNTLDSRLDLCFESLIPATRSILFPKKAAKK